VKEVIMKLEVIGKSIRTDDYHYRVVDARLVGGEWILYAEDESQPGTDPKKGPHRAALRYADVANIIDNNR
jgi:hypothetical protein